MTIRLNTSVMVSISDGGFTSSWKTDNVGPSNDDQIALPLVSTGTYDFNADWGDGSSNAITAWDQAETTHTYSSAGTYTVTITGTASDWRFNNAGDKLKILGISQWGDLAIKSPGAFWGCTNLNVTAADGPDLSASVDLSNMFNGCTSLVNCGIFDVSTIQNLNSMFQGCTLFNGLIQDWNVGSVTSAQYFLFNCTAFAGTLSSWRPANCTNMDFMLYNTDSLDDDLSAWTVQSLTTAVQFLDATGISTANYDALLIGWESQSVQNNVSFHGGTSKYTPGGAAATAHAALIGDHSWVIADGGAA